MIDSEKCIGCRLCYDACPYGAPVFESDEFTAKAQKCDMCIDRLEQGNQPICVMTCRSRALDFGPIETLKKMYGTSNSELEDMPRSELTKPAVLFKHHACKRQLVSYDSAKALQLMMKRDPLPPVFSSPADVLEIPDGIIDRNKLVLKHSSAEELMFYTKNDEG